VGSRLWERVEGDPDQWLGGWGRWKRLSRVAPDDDGARVTRVTKLLPTVRKESLSEA
jgi:hypothetical protein